MPEEWQNTEFETIYRSESAYLFAFIRKRVRDEDVASDILQETFFSFHKAMQNRDMPENVRAYLFRIARNHLIKNIGRRDSKNLELNREVVGRDDQEQDNIQSEVRVALTEAISELEGIEREAMELRWQHGFSSTEIAEVIKKSDRHVRRLLESAAIKMRQTLAKKGWQMADLLGGQK